MDCVSELVTLPGFVDVHVHLREPSPENKAETIENGTRAALLGGYVEIHDMPNTPGRPTWTVERLDEKIAIAAADTAIPTYFHAGSQPESNNLDQLGEMSEKASGLKLYRSPTTGNEQGYTAKDFEPIVKEWHRVAPDKPILLHDGTDLLKEMVDLVARKNEHPLHICHVNDPWQVLLKERARSSGLDVTCGVTPHHLFMTSHDVKTRGWFARMQPPLRTYDAAEVLWKQLAAGKIEVIESDYAPHTLESKWAAEEENPQGIHDSDHRTCFGVPGIEHIGPMMLRQVKLGNIEMSRLVDATHTQPLAILRREATWGTQVTWALEPFRTGEQDVQSGAGWTPYVGALGVGKVRQTMINNQIIHEAA